MLFGRYASRAAEARYPQLWAGRVFGLCPSVQGPAGLNVYDLSGRGRHSTLTNMDAPTDWVRSSGRYALDFDGTNDYARVASGMPQWQAASAWVSLNTTGATQAIVESYGASAVSKGLLLYATSAGKAAFDGRDTGGTYRSSGASTTTVVNVGWVHIFGQYTDRLEIWVNGVKESQTATALTAFPTLNDLNIGGLDTGGELVPTTGWLSGMIDDLALFNRPLTAGEIRLLATRRGIAYEARRDVFGQDTGARRRRIITGMV